MIEETGRLIRKLQGQLAGLERRIAILERPERTDQIEYRAITPIQITANKNDYDLGEGKFFRLSTDASRNITGLANGKDGRKVVLANVGSNDFVITNQDAASVAANRVITGTGASVTYSADDVALLRYDIITLRWRLIL